MVKSTLISVGTRVEGSFGPLVANPNPNIKRRVRMRVTGTVMNAVGQHNWSVLFDFDGKTQEVHSRSLKIVQNETAIPAHELYQSKYILQGLYSFYIISILTNNLSFQIWQ